MQGWRSKNNKNINWQYDWECIYEHCVKISRMRNEWLDVAMRLSDLIKMLDARLIKITCTRSELAKRIRMYWQTWCEIYSQYKW